MYKEHFLGSRDEAETFTKYTYLNDNNTASIVANVENWSGNDVDSALINEYSKDYKLDKDQAFLVEQAMNYEKCQKALRKWAVDFVDFKDGKSDEKAYLNSEKLLQRKIVMNRAKNINALKDNKPDTVKNTENNIAQKVVDVFREKLER